MEKYIKWLKNNKGNLQNPLQHLIEKPIKEFKYWLIIENEFPYDAIAENHHMLVPKRQIGFDWSLLNTEETDEYNLIRKEYLPKVYDVVWENLPDARTIPVYFHIHLLKLKRERVMNIF